MPPPGAPDWESAAVAWLLDQCPPEYRTYPTLRRHAVVLARFAVLHVEAEVLEVRPSRSRPDRGMAVVRMETVDREGAVAQVFTVTMVVPRRPSAGDAGNAGD